METIALKQNAVLLEKHIKEAKGKFTLNDAAAITGVPTETARESLNELMSKYICQLQVSENGDLIYDFGSSPTRRGEKTFKEIIEGIQNQLWKAFQVFFKAWITVTLVVYFVIFVVILIAFIVAMSSSDKKGENKNTNATGMLGGIADMFFAIFRWNTLSGGTYYQTDNRGYSYKTYKPEQSKIFNNQNKSLKGNKNFISSVYDFVFGAKRYQPEPFANHQEVAAYARKNKGLMILPEFKALAGWDNEQGQNFMTDCIARFNGSAQISSHAVLYADFYDLTRSSTQTQDGKIEFYWDEYEPEYELTGNTTGRNTAIIAINAFNLIFASLFLFGTDIAKAGAEIVRNEEIIFWGLGVVPFVFSLIFFATPLCRYFSLLPKKKQRRRNNIRKRLMNVIYNKGVNEDLSLPEILQIANTNHPDKLTEADIEAELNKLVADWEGEALPKDDGRVVFQFQRLREEIQEVAKLRQNLKTEKGLGNTYFDTNS